MRRWLPFLGALPAAAHAAPTVAMNGHLPSTSDTQGMAALGAASVRMDFNWFQFEPAPNTFSFTALDSAVQDASQQGLQIYATVAYTPQWASSVPTCVPGSSDPTARCENKLPANVSDWTTAVTAVVTHFQGQIDCWGIWNEPNLQGFFDGTEDEFVTEIFSPAAAAIRAADPNARICGPELAGLTASSNWNGQNGQCILGQCIRNGWEIDLGDMLDKVGTDIDVVTQHFYEADATSVVSALLDGTYFGTLLTHDSVKHVIESHGAGAKPFWLTETGWEQQPQGSNPPSSVATWIVALYDDEEQVCAGTYAASTNVPWANWERTFYYDYPCDPTNGWGIVSCSGTPLQPYTALQTWAASHTVTACGASSTAADAGSPADASVPVDAGLPPGPDAGASPDASEPSDAGISSDAGATMPDDAGPADDAGGQPGPSASDSGATNPSGPDGSSSTPGPSAGCACSTAPLMSTALPAGFVLFGWRRWRRNTVRPG